MEAKNEVKNEGAGEPVRKYRVTCTIAGPAGELHSEDVEGHWYETQATSGAGLVADFYDTRVRDGKSPASTVAHVAAVRELHAG